MDFSFFFLFFTSACLIGAGYFTYFILFSLQIFVEIWSDGFLIWVLFILLIQLLLQFVNIFGHIWLGWDKISYDIDFCSIPALKFYFHMPLPQIIIFESIDPSQASLVFESYLRIITKPSNNAPSSSTNHWLLNKIFLP